MNRSQWKDGSDARFKTCYIADGGIEYRNVLHNCLESALSEPGISDVRLTAGGDVGGDGIDGVVTTRVCAT